MKVYLDDERNTPEGWLHCCWPDEVIRLLEFEQVTHLSLDHDLGDDERGTGYDVLLWLEKKVMLDGLAVPGHIQVHSDNSSAREKMERAIKAINRRALRWIEEKDIINK